MSNIVEIETAIANLPSSQVDQLAHWLDAFRQRRAAPVPAENWLQTARGAAATGVRTEDVLALTRGEE